MPSLNCHQSFDEGVAMRAAYPLCQGEYKLREFRYRTDQILSELAYIREYKSGRVDRWGLQFCTPLCIYLWLRDVPENLSYMIAFNLLPSIKALRFNGIEEARITPVLSLAQRQAKDVVASLEDVRQTLRRRIGVEYNRMRSGDPTLEPLVKMAVCIADDALCALGLPPEREVL